MILNFKTGHIRIAAFLAGCLLMALAYTGCVREDLELKIAVPEGEPATVSLKIALPEMEIQTRAMSDDDKKNARTVNTVWVGIFNATTGEKTFGEVFDLTNDEEHDKDAVTGTTGFKTLNDIETKSGNSYIVAVANVTGNYGISDNTGLTDRVKETLNTTSDRRRYELQYLLNDVQTWEEYLSIAAINTQADNISSLSANVPMSGIYLNNNDTHPTGAGWIGKSGEVTIPLGTTTLSGAIHLRRLFSYLEFNIAAAEGITFKFNSWKVHNIPYSSCLHEQDRNSGDELQYYFDHTDFSTVIENNYNDGQTIFNPTVVSTNPDKYTFSFWQFENKREGLADTVSVYHDREKEYKDETGLNTGIYKSLCSTDAPPNINLDNGAIINAANYASFVELNGEVSYKVNDNGELDDNGTTYRTATVKYTVHLGYCEGKDSYGKATETTARDFNCRRNTDYTYNITINGVNNIVVEVKEKNQEPTPGAEGIVTDTSENPIELDAHYNVFNIAFTEEELKNLTYKITAPFNGKNYLIDDSESDENRDFAFSDFKDAPLGQANIKCFQEQLATWIAFKPTKKGYLRKFKDIAASSDEINAQVDDDMLYLDEANNQKGLKNYDVANHPFGSNEDGLYWFTVFVREYVYYYKEDGGILWKYENEENPSTDHTYTETGWQYYVNQDIRKVELSVKSLTSSDRESVYNNAKYLITQRSIQTFFSLDAATNGNGTAFGIEHLNESYGLNMRHTVSTDGFTNSNGRYDLYIAINNGNNNWNYYIRTTSIKDNNGKSYNVEEQSVSPEIKGTGITADWKISAGDYAYRPASEYYVPALTTISSSSISYDPNTSGQYYEAIFACLSRNRDINGNGVIDANEMRWYLPTAGKYLRIQIGENALQNPLLRATAFDPSNYKNNDEHPYFHFISSEGKLIWTEQGASLGNSVNPTNAEDWQTGWEIRCIRNLGCAPYNTPATTDPVQDAYHIDKESNTVIMDYYDAAVIRTQSRSYIQAHPTTSELNKPYHAFQYAKDDLNTTGSVNNVSISGYNMNNWNKSNWYNSLNSVQGGICSLYSEESDGRDKGSWRVPTQSELSILRRLSENDGNSIFDIPSDTGKKRAWISCSHEILGATLSGNAYFYAIVYTNDADKQYWTGTTNFTGDNAFDSYRVRCVRDIDD